MQGIMDFLAANKDALTIILGVIGGVLVAIWGAWKLLFERWWKQRLRIEVKVFDVVTDPAKLLPRLFNRHRRGLKIHRHQAKEISRLSGLARR